MNIVNKRRPEPGSGSLGPLLLVGLSPALGRVIVLPRLARGAVNRAEEYLEVAAGKAVNAARVVCESGRHAVLVTPVGEEHREQFSKMIAGDEVELRAALYPGRIRWAVTLVERENPGATEIVINEASPIPAAVVQPILTHVATALNGAAGCILAGSRLPDIPRAVITDIVRLARDKRIPVFLDLRGADLLAALQDAGPPEPGGAVTVVKINEEEFRDSAGRAGLSIPPEEPPAAYLKEFADRFGCTLVVTRGKGPVLYAARGDVSGEISVPPVIARNPIGSGDTLLAILAVNLTEGVPLESAVREAVHYASRNAEFLKPGTITGP